MIEKIVKIYLVASLVLFAEQGFSQSITLSSPDKSIKAVVNPGNETSSLVTYDLWYDNKAVVKNATVAFDMDHMPAGNFHLSKIEMHTIFSSWQNEFGERKTIPDRYNQVIFHFTHAADTSLQLKVICRAYNEGFAFRYSLDKKGMPLVLKSESSTFPFTTDATAWVSIRAQSPIEPQFISNIKGEVERPVTIQASNHLFAALGEASLSNFARMKFVSDAPNTLVTQLAGKVTVEESLQSPWRYILLGKSPGELLEKNYLLLNLNAPNQIPDPGWIHPGKVIREATLTTAGSKLTIDFAAKHQIRYICFDSGWYGKEDSDTSDATRVSIDPARYRGPLDLKEVIAYGESKNVGVILYVNRRVLERQLDTLLPLYQAWGIKGLKFGFVNVGSQQWTQWLHEAVRKAAKYKMVVDIHDEYRPTGYSRTYPNLLTQEGIRGDEESPFIEHTIKTVFTRGIAGAADNTVVYFTNRVDKMGSHAAQMAKAVCIFSPLEFLYWYDRPVPAALQSGKEGEIAEVPELKWFDALPVVWDTTLVMESNIEEFATIARKKNGEWFVGSLNGIKGRSVNWKLDFLDKDKKYKATIYTDDPSLHTRTNVRISQMEVDAGSTLSFTIAERNGVAVHIMPL